MIAIGLVSGTSLDGVDAALVELRPTERGGYDVRLLDFLTQPYDAPMLERLRATLPPNEGSASVVAELHRDLGAAFARAARAVAPDRNPDYVASHGHTLWHDGKTSTTFQIGDAFVIGEAMHATVCYDFRSADCAVGGHGAPLVPYADALLLGSEEEDRVALNIGGIANLTILPRGAFRDAAGAIDVIAYDTGPGTMLIDAFVRGRTSDLERFDRDGALANRGNVNVVVLDAMLADEYFALPAPKSTGRERFGEQFLQRFASNLAALTLEDGTATLTELTAATVSDEVERAGMASARIVVSGGGARNLALLQRLQARLPKARVEASDALGIDADAKEAVAFAILGYETLRGRAANVPRVTGASRAVVLGAIVPVNLPLLLARVAAECA